MSSSDTSAPQTLVESWVPPIPISDRPMLPDFPLSLIPDPLADWADALARNTETAVDLAATLSLAVVSAATAGKVVAQLGDGWRETLSLYLLVALPSGELKSPVFRAAIEPIVKYEKRLAIAANETIAIQQTERDVLEMALRRAKSEAAAAHGASQELNLKVQECRRRLNAARVQALPQLLASDLTPQGLIRTLAEQDERLAIMTDEGELAETLRAPGGIDIFLKAYDGSAYRVNRAGTASVHLEQPSLVLAATIQPALARQLTNSAAFRERGLLGRMTFVIPQSRVGTRRWERAPIPDEVNAAYSRAIRQLLEIEVDRDSNGKPVRHNLAFERDAVDELRSHRSDIEKRMAWGDLVGIETFANKHAARVARIASLIRLAAVGLAGMVTREDVRRAIGLGEYFIAHARATLQHLDLDPVAKLAKRVVEWAIRSGVEQVTKAEVNAALRPDAAADLDEPFELLLRHHFVRPLQVPTRTGPGRKPGTIYELNPHIRGSAT